MSELIEGASSQTNNLVLIIYSAIGEFVEKLHILVELGINGNFSVE